MPPASLPQLALPFEDASNQPDNKWYQKLLDAFADEEMISGFLPLAEEALRMWPGDPRILCLAATAALLDRDPERALVFLKRYSKRYVPTPTHHLLYALAAEEQNKPVVARAILEHYGLTSPFEALRAFPGGWTRRKWLNERLANIFGKPGRKPLTAPVGRTAKTSLKTAPKAAIKAAPKTASKMAPKTTANQTERRQSVVPRARALPPPTATNDAATGPAGLARIEIHIPLPTEFNPPPLLKTAAAAPERDGAWYLRRERFAHLGLAPGFDELLCLPHLNGIETFWYQVETVRNVLKQFRGRVLLADEVGLGKTIEAGMVLKEYLLRGMVERVLVLTPASLVGQWRAKL